MLIELNFKSGFPAYLQIVEQVKRGAAAGALREGDQLPSIRELAERLRINRNTVAKAYAELEHEGVAETVQGKGVFVTGSASPFSKKVRASILIEAVDAAVVQAHQLQVGPEEFLGVVRARLDDFEKRRRQS